MQYGSTRSLIEGGILVAVAIIFALISVYLPLAGSLVSLIWPVPIILLGVRHGCKWSMLATLVAGILIAILLHPLHAVGVVVGFGLIGIVLGHALRVKFHAMKTLLLGTLASLVSKIAVLFISAIVLGINPLHMQFEMMEKSFEQAVGFYRTMGMKEEDLALISTNMGAMLQMLKAAFPAIFTLVAVIDTYLNFVVAKLVLKRLGHQVPELPAFKYWNLPGYVVYFYILALVGLYWGTSREIDLLYNASINVQLVASLLLLMQGLALFYYLTDKYKLSRLARGIILLLILTNGLFTQILVVAGAFDIVFDYRQLRRPQPD